MFRQEVALLQNLKHDNIAARQRHGAKATWSLKKKPRCGKQHVKNGGNQCILKRKRRGFDRVISWTLVGSGGQMMSNGLTRPPWWTSDFLRFLLTSAFARCLNDLFIGSHVLLARFCWVRPQPLYKPNLSRYVNTWFVETVIGCIPPLLVSQFQHRRCWGPFLGRVRGCSLSLCCPWAGSYGG